MMDNLNLYAKWEKAEYNYTVKFYKDSVSNDNHISGADTTGSAAFGTTLSALSVNKTIAEGKCPNGYNTTGTIDEENSLATITAGENVVKVVLSRLAEYKITIHYVDDATTPATLKDDIVIGGKHENDAYNVNNEIPARIGDYVKESVTGGNAKGTMGNSDVSITVVYTKDVLVDPTVPKTDGPGDNIPDKYQVTINYVDDNTGRGKITGPTKEVKTIYENGTGGKWASTGDVTASGSTAEATGSRNYFSNWTDKDNTEVGKKATLEAQTIKNAEGGKTYTFTANFSYSGGGGGGSSSRPSTPPTVEIPDDVPTGLNGKDHYAYIIGYGNNDVRPQNNVTRAEVATIFFRLLTDETREANMTKSNGYNDVKDGDWFCCAVSTLSKMGIIKGYEDGSFKPNDPISRAEFAAIAARFDPDGDKTPASFQPLGQGRDQHRRQPRLDQGL